MDGYIINQGRLFRVRQKTTVVILWDWDGTLVDTMPAHADLAANCINKHFQMNIPEARRRYLNTTGIPFDRQLEAIFPSATPAQREACAKEYHERKMTEVYGNPDNFPQTIKILEKLSQKVFQVISSSTEEEIIGKWVEKNGIKIPIPILGRESGSKKDHIEGMRKEIPNAVFVFVSDSSGDMDLPVDMTFGVNAPKNKVEQFVKEGAAIVSKKPISLVWADYCFKQIGLV